MPETIASEVLSASLGGAISASILYPLEVLKTKMQAETKTTHSNTDNNENSTTSKDSDRHGENDEDMEEEQDRSQFTMVEYAQYLHKSQGIQVFFSGVELSAIQSATEKALYFFAYTGFKSIYRALLDTDAPIGTMTSLVLGCAAEWAHLPITLPLDCWTTAIQTNTNKSQGPMQLLLALLSDKGLKGMYKGIQAYTVLCLKPALQYTIFEQVKAAVVAPRKNKSLSAAEAFCLGMVARAISTIFIFPYIRAKVVLQTTKSSDHGSTAASGSIPQMLSQMYTEGGFATWFQGLAPELTRGVLSSALMLMMKEQIGQVVQAALQPNSNSRPRSFKGRRV